MFKWKEFEKISLILSQMGGKQYFVHSQQHHLVVRPNELLDWVEFIKEDLGFFTLSEIAGIELSQDRFEVIYHLLNMGIHQRLNIHLLVEKSEVIPSLNSFYPHANWPEREQAEMLGLTFNEKKEALLLPEGQTNFPLRLSSDIKGWPVILNKPLPKINYNPNKSEASYPEENYRWKRFDLLSPNSLGHFEWNVCFDPEKVIEAHVEIGFHHQGLEKLFQKEDLFKIVHLVDKINVSSAPQYSIAWTKSIEDVLRIKIPERAQAIRIIMLELGRIADHLSVLQAICFESNQDEHRHFINAREKICELLEKFTGHRFGMGISRIGGVRLDLPHGWIVEFQNVHNILMGHLKTVHNSLINQRKFRNKLDHAFVNSQLILQSGVSGPAMRAAGLNFDLRKSQPFYFYEDIDFDIPIGINGSTYDRYLVRFEEIFQSLRIITQVVDNLPLGVIVADEFNMNHLELVKHFEQLKMPQDWQYSALESSGGEVGFLFKFSTGLCPQRIKIKTPSFSLASALPIFVKGLRENQLRVSVASLGISRWEMDR